MAGDYSRKRFNPEKHYQGVLRQQGRVDLDADWNEYVDLQNRRWRAETIDLIGRYGVPSETPDGFKIEGTVPDLAVGEGRIYVDGLLAENHGVDRQFNATLDENYGAAPVPIVDQPYGIKDLQVPTQGRSLVYVDVWRREVTHLQEPGLIEPAVNVDTTTRAQTAWQVKILEDLDAAVTCDTPLSEVPGWPPENLPSSARLSTKTIEVSAAADLCLVPPSGGYRGLENHLYRVEVHELTSSGSVLVKWSRENAHVAASVLEIGELRQSIRVESLGRDDVLRFNDGDWVEITSDAQEFAGTGGHMRKVTVNKTDLTLSFADPLDEEELKIENHLRVIRWDQSGDALTSDGLIELSAANPSFVLENGIQVELTVLANGTAHAGDYWCFAARTADADIERLEKAPPLGVHHHFCKLAIIDSTGVIQDCRPVFPALTELTSLFYVSGDGQEALPGQPLPQPIQVGVANGKRPVAGVTVRFHVSGGNGSLNAGVSGVDITVLTDALGVASCVWTLDGANQNQQVEAMLADGSHLPVRFNATLSQPGGAEPGIHVRSISVGGKALGNDTDVTVAEVASGITITCDDNPFHGSVFNKPVCFVTLEVPFLWKTAVVGFQPVILAADVNSQLELIFWQAKAETKAWLEAWPFKTEQKPGDRLLARLTLKGNFIWGEKNPNLFLDGEVFGTPTSAGAITAVKFPSGDKRRGGDLEMWFWLVEGKPKDVKITIKPDTATVALGESVEFDVAVEGTADKTVEMLLDPKGAGALKAARENVWTYTAPQDTAPTQVKVIATSNADPTKPVSAVAVVNILGGQQGIDVTIAPLKVALQPGGSQDFTVTVQGGNVKEVEMRVDGVLNGDPRVGTIKEKAPGIWTYSAPDTEQTVTIRASSQKDATKFATADVTISKRNLPNRDASPRGRPRRSRT